jgi:CO dehydrogenase maturation factor
MKIAITGKGGVGKTTIAAAIALIVAERGDGVLAVDADPDANLASALGIPYSRHGLIRTIALEKKLIEERTGSGEFGAIFKLNPHVSDIADTYAYRQRGVDLIVLGAVRAGGSGCACPESALLRTLVQELVLRRREHLVLDMEAGIEHLGRATAKGVDCLIAVAEPGARSIATVHRIAEMAREIGIAKTLVVINGVKSDAETCFLQSALAGFEIVGIIPYHEAIRANDRDGRAVIDDLPANIRACFDSLIEKLLLNFS